MRKLRLELDALAVETFEVPAAEARAGTVRGHVVSGEVTCSMSQREMCFAPPETITADPYAGECNTLQCGGGSTFVPYSCQSQLIC